MSYAIIGETIKSATSIALGELFNGAIRYKEPMTDVDYPHFFISQVDMQATPTGRKRLQLDYLMNIRYRVASDIQTISNINEKLDEIGMKLCTQFLTIDLERPVKVENRRYEKDNGVLQFFFNVTVFAVPEEEEVVKFKNYDLESEVI